MDNSKKTLNSQQRAYLRGLANGIKVNTVIGKEGITDALIRQAMDDIEAHELIKCSVLETCPLTARETLHQLSEIIGAYEVQCIGRRFVLYKPSETDPVIMLKQ